MRSNADVVIIGGGIIGFSVAFHLARMKCGQIVLVEKEALIGEGSVYLERISRVVAERNQGKLPEWMKQLFAAPSVKKCQEGFRSFLGSSGGQAARPVATPKTKNEEEEVARPELQRQREIPPQPQRRREAPSQSQPQRADPQEQLPPWLAPQPPD